MRMQRAAARSGIRGPAMEDSGCGGKGGVCSVPLCCGLRAGAHTHDTPLSAPRARRGTYTETLPGRGAAALFVQRCRSRGDNPDRLLESH